MKPDRNRQAKMKKLIFIRHGKAEDQAADISDFERSLTLRGKSQSRAHGSDSQVTGEKISD